MGKNESRRRWSPNELRSSGERIVEEVYSNVNEREAVKDIDDDNR